MIPLSKGTFFFAKQSEKQTKEQVGHSGASAD